MDKKDERFVLVASFSFLVAVGVFWLFNPLQFRSNPVNVLLAASMYAIALLFISSLKKEFGIKIGLDAALAIIFASLASLVVVSSQTGGVSSIGMQAVPLVAFILSVLVSSYEV